MCMCIYVYIYIYICVSCIHPVSGMDPRLPRGDTLVFPEIWRTYSPDFQVNPEIIIGLH